MTDRELPPALADYRDQVRAANPAIPPDEIDGDDFGAIDRSASAARERAAAAAAAKGPKRARD